MTEQTLQVAFLARLRAALPDAVVFKHRDEATIGLPDVSVTWNGRTAWLELKHARSEGGLRKAVQAAQLATVRRLRRASGGRACFAVYVAARHACAIELWDPAALSGRLGGESGWPFATTGPCRVFRHDWLVEQVREMLR